MWTPESSGSYLSPSLCRSDPPERKVNGTATIAILGGETSGEDGCVCSCQGCLGEDSHEQRVNRGNGDIGHLAFEDRDRRPPNCSALLTLYQWHGATKAVVYLFFYEDLTTALAVGLHR